MQRPQRIRITNEAGKLQTLPEGENYFQDLGGQGEILFLGLGPSPELATDFCSREHISYIECPSFYEQVPAFKNIPTSYKRIYPENLDTKSYRIILYTPNKRLFPSFWGPIISQLTIARSGINDRKRQKSIWIPGDENSLLVPELTRAFASAGFTYRVIEPDAMCKNLLSMLESELPEIVLSINYKGLDNSGETFFMLREAGVKTLVWMVDNPFHIISGIKSDYWKQVPTMVTDQWFIDQLKSHGVFSTGHLPLATDPIIFNRNTEPYPALSERIVFVGRSSFPDKKNFFAGCSFTENDRALAEESIRKGIKPDFAWWAKHDRINRFWPGTQIRKTGFKTEQSGLMWRLAALRESGTALTLFGDDGWRSFLKDADIRPPVDYFTTLPSIYRGSGISLNMTSPLLPSGLTQRNFDVWAAGGFLLTDFTPGLDIFPKDLVAECTFSHPAHLPNLYDKILTNPNLRQTLTKIWHHLISEKHTYKNRVDNILNFIEQTY